MSKRDEDEFLGFLRSSGNLVIRPSRSSSPEFPELDTLPQASQSESTRKFWLQNREINLPLFAVSSNQGDYVIDGFQSPVVEFLRSFTISGMMLPGRLQADMTYFDGEKQDLVSKPVDFRRWFDSMDSWIRKKYVRVTLLTYAGPGAEQFREQGGLLH
jgi:hypothetical protein